MIERAELNNLSRTEPVRAVIQPKENSLEKTDKPFVAELKEKLHGKKKKKEKEKDEIIIHEEQDQNGRQEKDENEEEIKNQSPVPSDGLRGIKIDLIA